VVKEMDRPAKANDFSKAENRKLSIRNIFTNRVFTILIVLIFLVVVIGILEPRFVKYDNILTIMRSMSIITIASVGVTFCMIAGEIDISVGSQMGFYAVVMGLLILKGINPVAAFFITMLVGLFVGAFNGVLITKVGAPSFIATLGMLSLLRGLSLILTNGWPVMGFAKSNFIKVMGGMIFNNKFPVQVLWMLLILIIGGILLARTVFGQHVFAVGGNKIAAKFAGINTDRIKITTFMISAACCVVGGAVMLGFMKAADPLGGTGMELQAIIAVVVGGTAMAGGSGNIIGTFIGAAIFGVIWNGMIFLGVSSYWNDFATGALLLVAVSIDYLIRRRKA
jgi:ribose transport system permease protein